MDEIPGMRRDYVAGELHTDVLADFERHLDACANCREYLRQYRATIAQGQVLGTHDEPGVPEDLVKAVLATIRKPASP